MKRNNFNLLTKIKSMLLFGVAIALFSSCNDYMQGKTFLTSDERMIDEYIEQQDTSMTEFLNVVDKAGFRGMLHAYGTNTCFIPTNAAIKSYCASRNLSSLESLPVEELEQFIKFHIVRDTLESSSFVDGRLSRATMLGKYLTTKTIIGVSAEPMLQVNRQAFIVKKDIRVANGIIHKIDNVLTPNPKTVGEMIAQLPESYSLFKQVMQESGMIDTLTNNKSDGEWYTVFLQSNASFATQGVTDLASLLEKMKIAQPDYSDNPIKLVEIYAQYHCLNRLAYVTDLSLSSAELSIATNQVITFKNNKDSLILNEYQSLTKFEKGITVNKLSEWTDMSCYNGVMVDLDGYIEPVKRGPEAIYWDMADQPEIKKAKEYRKPGAWISFKPGELSELNFGGKNNPTVTYSVNSAYGLLLQHVNYDHLDVPFYPNIVQWMEIKTPVLTEGVYNVWFCWRRTGTNNKFKTTFKQEGLEAQPLPNVFDLGEYFADKATAEVNLNNGMKQYNAKYTNSVFCSRNCGAIKVEYTGRHTLRLDALSGTSQAIQFDMIQFIPVDQNQLWPRFDVEGKAVYPETPCLEIAPKEQDCYDFNNSTLKL